MRTTHGQAAINLIGHFLYFLYLTLLTILLSSTIRLLDGTSRENSTSEQIYRLVAGRFQLLSFHFCPLLLAAHLRARFFKLFRLLPILRRLKQTSEPNTTNNSKSNPPSNTYKIPSLPLLESRVSNKHAQNNTTSYVTERILILALKISSRREKNDSASRSNSLT